MNIFKAAWNALFEKKAAPVSNGRGAYYVNNGQVVWVADNFERYVVDGYSANDIVYSINFITSEKIKIAPWGAYTVEDESSLKSYRAELAKKEINVKAALHYRTKALKPFNGDGKLNELLKWPNEHETFSDLVAHSSVAKMMTGNRQVRGVLLDAGANAGKPQSLELLPPQFMIPVVSKTFPVNLIGWQLSCGQIIAISKEEVMHDKYYNPLYDMYGGHLIGMAPLRAASKTLTNANSALEASTKSFQNMGPGGVMFIDDQRVQPEQAIEQMQAMKKQFYEEYSGSSNAKKVVMSGYKTGYEQLGLSPVDLQIIEQEKWNLVRFCNVWNFPHPLLLPDHLTDNNYAASEKALVTRCALPLLTSFRDNFNRKLGTDWGYKGKNIYVDFDLSVYSELQPDYKGIADWTSKSPLTIRQIFETMQYELPKEYQNNPMVDKIFVPNNKVLLDDLDPANIDRVLDEVDEEGE